jgi:hypothetical protein
MCSMWQLSTRNNAVPIHINTNVMSCFVSCFMCLWYPWTHSSHIVFGTPEPIPTIHSLALHVMVLPFAVFFQDCNPCEWRQFSIYCYIHFKEPFPIWILQLHKIRNPTYHYPQPEKAWMFYKAVGEAKHGTGKFRSLAVIRETFLPF